MFLTKLQVIPTITWSVFLKILTLYAPHITPKEKAWGVFCELIISMVKCMTAVSPLLALSHRFDPCYLLTWKCCVQYYIISNWFAVTPNHTSNHPDSKVQGATMGPTWVLSAPDGPHGGPINLAVYTILCQSYFFEWSELLTRSQECSWVMTSSLVYMALLLAGQ